jgi:hypothetical protein
MTEYLKLENLEEKDIKYLGKCIIECNQRISSLTEIITEIVKSQRKLEGICNSIVKYVEGNPCQH